MAFSYVGNFPNQQKSNSGVLSLDEYNNLESNGELGGSLEHIQTISADSGGTTNFDFTNIGQYKVHMLLVENAICTTNATNYIEMRFSTDGGSSFISTSSYDRAWTRVDRSGNTLDVKNADQTSMSNLFSTDNDYTSSQSRVYFYDLVDANKNSNVSFHSVNSVGYYVYYGGFVYKVKNAVNAIRIFASADALYPATFKLYGLKDK